MALEMISRDVFVRLTDPSGKRKPIINHHRAWDPGLFIANQVKQYDTDAKPEERRLVSMATAADYRAYRNQDAK